MNQEVIGIGELPREGLRDRVLALRSQTMFEGLDDEGLLMLAEHARNVTYREGDVVTVEGSPQRFIFVVLEGELLVSVKGKPPLTIPAGKAFGSLGMLAREPCAEAVATTRVRVLEVPVAAFETALDENYSLLRSALAACGALVLQMRGNLPVNPRVSREVDEGTYYTTPKSMVERLIQLRSGTWTSMNIEALIDLARHMVEVRYPADHLLWSVGDVSTHSLFVDCGRVRCTAPDGKHVDIGRNFTLGVLDVWGTRRRAYEARTVTPVIAYQIEFEGFLTLLESHVEVGVEMLRGFARAMLANDPTK
jgi:CRP-like cAMP-binding protein